MKTLVILLALFITFLAIEPSMNVVVSTLSDTKVGCSVTECTPFSDCEDSQDQDDDCNGKTCNPFQVCNSCVLLVNKVVSYDVISNPGISSERIFSYYSACSSTHTSSCWHPPRVV